MTTLIFCTAWADSEGAWRQRYGRWLDAVLASNLERTQVLLVDDASPCPPPFPGLADCPAESLPAERPTSPVVFARFATHLGRPGILDYPGWWRSFAFAARYATRYGFDKVIHLESDTFLLSARLHDHVNALDAGWTVFWCPRWGFPETCIQVIGRDQLPAFEQVTSQDYSTLVGRPVEQFLPFTRVESSFKGDRYGEYRTELPLDADYASQIPSSTATWHGTPPPPRRVLPLTLGASGIPPHPALYPTDAWRHLPPAAGTEAASLQAALARQAPASLDAVALTLEAHGQALPIPPEALRARLAPDGELTIQFRDGQVTRDEATAVARGLFPAGFPGVGLEEVPSAGCWVIGLAPGTLAPAVAQERLGRRLRLVAACRLGR